MLLQPYQPLVVGIQVVELGSASLFPLWTLFVQIGLLVGCHEKRRDPSYSDMGPEWKVPYHFLWCGDYPWHRFHLEEFFQANKLTSYFSFNLLWSCCYWLLELATSVWLQSIYILD